MLNVISHAGVYITRVGEFRYISHRAEKSILSKSIRSFTLSLLSTLSLPLLSPHSLPPLLSQLSHTAPSSPLSPHSLTHSLSQLSHFLYLLFLTPSLSLFYYSVLSLSPHSLSSLSPTTLPTLLPISSLLTF